MRTLPILFAVALFSCTFVQARAWDRDTVDGEISKLCEQRNPDDWPAQDDCIAAQRRALQSLRPPRDDKELVAEFRTCKEAASSDYDFAALQGCYKEKSSAIITERTAAKKIAEKEKLTSIFPTLPMIVQCSFSDGRTIEIRRSGQYQGAIIAKVSPEVLFAGRSGIGYSYEWGGAQGTDFKLDGNQLTDRSAGKAKLLMGKCDYR